MTNLTLLRRGHELSSASHQRRLLEAANDTPRFDEVLEGHGAGPLRSGSVEILQVNVGRLCNQTCRHCHVDAGPDRREVASRETLEACLRVVAATEAIRTVDVTGGAPEMNPHFRWFVREVRSLGRHVIDRCNLTILLVPGHEDLPWFLAELEVEVVASLPCYLEENVDRQRGNGVFHRSIAALRLLNGLGYGRPDSGLVLSLVYNPVGPSLPPPQSNLEADYRRELRARYGVEFTRLFTITNMPISRYLEDLLENGRYDEYLARLVAAFEPGTLDGLMCRNTLSVDWQGRLFDCDFNQMLDLEVASPAGPTTIHDLDPARLANRPIVTGRHCFGCTAGSGSSCQGALLRTEV